MTLSFVDTPLPEEVPALGPRTDAWNPALDPALFASPGSENAIARLRLPGALVVTTGQQPGLFTGPGYAITKALSARALALALEQRWQRPVVPVYWVPGDDHDLHEVATVTWLNGEGELRSASLAPRAPDAPLTPMWRQPLGEEVLSALHEFEDSFAATPERNTTVEWLRRHYCPDATVSAAYGAAMAELLGPFGVVCLDGAHPAVKRAAAGLVLEVLDHGADLERELVELARDLTAAGRDPGVPVGDGATPVFLDGPLGRDRLVRDGGSDRYHLRRSRATIGRDEIARIVETDPVRVSGNVLLRPVLESAVLPTVGYVAGPAELRYLALTAPIYRRLGITRQAAVPRWSGLIVEPRVTRVLRKYAAGVDEILADGHLEARIARQALPDSTDTRFDALREAIERGYQPVIEVARDVDPTMERPAASAKGQALFGLEELRKRLLQHARKRESVELGQVARARLSVRPHGKPQERVLTMAGFLARYGPGLLGELAAHIARWYG